MDLSATVDATWFQDPSFVQELLGSLPGVDINDSRIQKALKELAGSNGEGGGAGSSGSAQQPPKSDDKKDSP